MYLKYTGQKYTPLSTSSAWTIQVFAEGILLHVHDMSYSYNIAVLVSKVRYQTFFV